MKDEIIVGGITLGVLPNGQMDHKWNGRGKSKADRSNGLPYGSVISVSEKVRKIAEVEL